MFFITQPRPLAALKRRARSKAAAFFSGYVKWQGLKKSSGGTFIIHVESFVMFSGVPLSRRFSVFPTNSKINEFAICTDMYFLNMSRNDTHPYFFIIEEKLYWVCGYFRLFLCLDEKMPIASFSRPLFNVGSSKSGRIGCKAIQTWGRFTSRDVLPLWNDRRDVKHGPAASIAIPCNDFLRV